ncbi:FHA domain-containing protein [Burkholderia sp. Ac-20353]|uniref:FHA domain-containing protein n=1 Tax=Burkholderia sp. Ac-20353 TaxID=2703894 RepID=UPI00197B3DF9|nr:FHA domain-containing protein [Burkholderia sp. Ac-20353]MBN3785751.1 FHA domain-containing protein [Burkholderia sp. Ac-20353]
MNEICPKGHVSTDPEFCSECGVSMKPGSAVAGIAGGFDAPAAAGSETCPDCMTPRRPGARYCEMCRYDFSTRMSFAGLAPSTPSAASLQASVPDTGDAITVPAAPRSSAAAASPAAVNANSAGVGRSFAETAAGTPAPGDAPEPDAYALAVPRLKLRIVVDPVLYTEPAPDLRCPTDTPEKVFHLDLDENTLGRQYEGKGIHPEIVIHDPGISRRHLKFVRGSAGAYSVLELGSSNGTLMNRAALEPGVETPLTPGDELTLGMWTRIFVEAR